MKFAYQLGKDIQALHDKIDRITESKKCKCGSCGSTDKNSSTVTIDRNLLSQLLEQMSYLTSALHGRDIQTNAAVSYTLESFMEKYNPNFDPNAPFDWCCRVDNIHFGYRACHNITAPSQQHAFAQCQTKYCLQGGNSCSVTYKKCGKSDKCTLDDFDD
jgi:hypothetical protein